MGLKVSSNASKNAIYIILIFLIVCAIFTCTVKLRSPYFGTLSQNNHQWLTGDSLRFSRNWYREGPSDLRFGMFFNPASVEFPTLASRDLYCSYPPGTVLPIYVISKIAGSEPSVALINAYDLFNHFMIALFLSLTVFLFLLQLGFDRLRAFLLSIIPVMVILLTPAGLYWHQNVFFADQAVILPIVLFVFLEVVGKEAHGKRGRMVVGILQGLVFFYGMLTDWLFLFFALVVFVKRLCLGELGGGVAAKLKKSALFWLPAAISMGLFAIQLTLLDGWGQLADKFIFRTGISEGAEVYTSNFFRSFWLNHIRQGFGHAAIYLLWGSLIILVVALAYTIYKRVRGKAIDKNLKCTLGLAFILLLPCFLQVYFFRNHSAIHSFSTLKFELPLATVPFILMPMLLYYLARDVIREENPLLERLRFFRARHGRKILILPVLLMLLVACLYTLSLGSRFLSLFPETCDYIVEEFVGDNTTYEDVVFSPQYEIPLLPPQQAAISMKRVYRIESLDDISGRISGIEEDYTVNILAIDGIPMPDIPGLEELAERAFELVESGPLYLYKVAEEDALDVLGGGNVPG